MARLQWDQPGDRIYEAGVSHGILYPREGPGVAWNGLISISEDVSGGEHESWFFDGIKYFDYIAQEEFQATLTAFTYPDQFERAQGNRRLANGLFIRFQTKETFGLAWRTEVGDDIQGLKRGYKQHLVWNCTAEPAGQSLATIGATVDPSVFTWIIHATPMIPGSYLVNDAYGDEGDWEWPAGEGMNGWPTGPGGNNPIPGWKPTAYIMIEANDDNEDDLDDLDDELGGDDENDPNLPDPFDVLDHMNHGGPPPPTEFFYVNGFLEPHNQLPATNGLGDKVFFRGSQYGFVEPPQIVGGAGLLVLRDADQGESYMEINSWRMTPPAFVGEAHPAYLLTFPAMPMTLEELEESRWSINWEIFHDYENTFVGVLGIWCDVTDIPALFGTMNDEEPVHLGGVGSSDYGYIQPGGAGSGWEVFNAAFNEGNQETPLVPEVVSVAQAGNLGLLLLRQGSDSSSYPLTKLSYLAIGYANPADDPPP